MKKMILTMLCVMLMMSGCSTGKGKLEFVSIDHAFEMMDEKQTFLLLISRESCSHCEDMLDMLKKELPKQDLILYNVVMDESSEEAYDHDKKQLEERFEDPNRTPHVYFIQAGEVKDEQLGYSKDEPESFWDWVKTLPLNE